MERQNHNCDNDALLITISATIIPTITITITVSSYNNDSEQILILILVLVLGLIPILVPKITPVILLPIIVNTNNCCTKPLNTCNTIILILTIK